MGQNNLSKSLCIPLELQPDHHSNQLRVICFVNGFKLAKILHRIIIWVRGYGI